LTGSHDDDSAHHARLYFWHRPYPNTERQRYEQAIVRFQNDLAGSKPPGFIGATSFQIEAVPWLSDLPGYEDWYLLVGTWAMPRSMRLPYPATFRRPTTTSPQ
jgi:hypothetical protein